MRRIILSRGADFRKRFEKDQGPWEIKTSERSEESGIPIGHYARRKVVRSNSRGFKPDTDTDTDTYFKLGVARNET